MLEDRIKKGCVHFHYYLGNYTCSLGHTMENFPSLPCLCFYSCEDYNKLKLQDYAIPRPTTDEMLENVILQQSRGSSNRELQEAIRQAKWEKKGLEDKAEKGQKPDS